MTTLLRGMLWNPILARELRSRMRTLRTPLTITAFLLLVSASGYASFVQNPGSSSDPRFASYAGAALFRAVAAAEAALLVLLAPGLGAAAISAERERQTLDLLLCTPLGAGRIVAGKMLSALLFLLVLAVAALPLLSLALFLGGLEAASVLAAMAVLTTVTLMGGAIGLLCSVLLGRTAAATLGAYVTVAVIALSPFALGFFGPGLSTTRATGYGPSDCSSGVCQPQGPAGTASLVVAAASPVTAVGTVVEAVGGADCRTTPAPGGGVSVVSGACPDSDVIVDGTLRGRRMWQVSVVAQSVVTVVALTLATLALRGRRRGPARSSG